MKKIYSIVLMAAALLIGTNISAKTWSVGSISELENAWQNADSADVIRLTNDMQATKTFWMGTNDKTSAPLSITLDLNGHLLEGIGVGAANTANGMRSMFVISHGELNVVSTIPGGRIESNQWINGGGNVDQELFRVSGTNDENQDPKMTPDSLGKYKGYYSHLSIGENVTVHAKHMNAITIDAPDNAWPSLNINNAVSQKNDTLPTDPKKNVTVPLTTSKSRSNSVRIDISGIVKGTRYALKVNGNVQKPDNTDYSVFCHVHPTGYMWVPDTTSASKKPAAVYCSGYSRWLVEGTCIGATGLFAKSGEIDINNATIESNYTDTYQKPTETAGVSGVSASGSAIVIQSTSGYPGDIDVTISGDTKVSATNGYAIEEVVTAKDGNTDVQKITIEGGTFDGGKIPVDPTDPDGAQKDATMIISTKTAGDPQTVITISGFAITSNTGTETTDVTSTMIGDQDLVTFLNSQTDETHVTFIEGEDGRKTMVISEGEGPGVDETKTLWTQIAQFQDGTDAAWTGTGAQGTGVIANNETVTLGELQILSATDTEAQKLTIEDGGTLVVDHLLMNKYAQIEVQAGGKLIVKGTQGVVAPSDSCIFLEASETAQSTYLIKPNAGGTNRHPHATVRFKSKAFYEGGKEVHQRFGMPTYNGKVTLTPVNPGSVVTMIDTWDYAADDWSGWTNISSGVTYTNAEPFRGFMLASNNAKAAPMTYELSGELVGNDNANIHFYYGWNNLANSYLAPIDIEDFMTMVRDSKKNINATAYLYRDLGNDTYTWTPINLASIGSPYIAVENGVVVNDTYPTEIKPMQGFLMQFRTTGETADHAINYASSVYEPAMTKFNIPAAPARRRQANSKMTVSVYNTESADNVLLIEGNQFSNELENGYDAVKYEDQPGVQLYAMNNEERMSIVATDNVEGTFIGIDAPTAGEYNLYISGVNDMEYAIVDMQTGVATEITEGAMYHFYTEAGRMDYRFEIVASAKLPTAIENTAVNANVKGIYSITGMYMGENFDVLPKGAYIVNGVKVVK